MPLASKNTLGKVVLKKYQNKELLLQRIREALHGEEMPYKVTIEWSPLRSSVAKRCRTTRTA